MKKILFTGGGSAGHVLPNIALMEEILSTGEADVFYMGTDGIEKHLLAQWKLPFYQIDCPKLIRGGGWNGFKQNIKIPLRFQKAQKQAKAALQQLQPDLVFSKGGYVALPVVFAAKKLGIPCFSHESDFSAGLANRLMAKKCRRVFTSFPETAKQLKNGKYSGAPIRNAVFSSSRAEGRKKLGITSDKPTLLIFGGGSGSTLINQALRKHLKTLTSKYVLLHVCGKGNVVKTNIANYHQFEFIADMGAAYAAADMIISRAGAGALFEILALKKPSLLIPLEGQTRGDQLQNAAYFQRRNLCHVLRQQNLDALPSAIHEALTDKTVKEALFNSHFVSGNAVILQELRHALNE